MSETVKITSGVSPSEGQKHRSSENFTTERFGECELEVLITNPKTGQELNNVVFALKADKTGVDPVIDDEVDNGKHISNPSHRNLYIADPKVYGKDKGELTSFEVTFIKKQ